MPISVNGQLISLGGGGIGTWDPLTEPDKITAGENSSPGAFFLLNKMTNIIDDVAYASYGTLIFYDPEKERWQVGAGDEKNLGVFDNIAALQAKYPVGQAGQYALLKSTNTVWYWSTTTSAWVNGGSNVPADVLKQTDIVINLGSTDTTKVASASLATLLDDLKVDKVAGYSLTKNDFTDVLKTKLDGIQAGAEVNVQANWTQTNNTQDNYIANLPRDANQLPNFYIKSEVYSKTESDTLFIENSEKAQPNGVATLDASGKVPLAQLNPAGVSYYPSFGNFPNPGFVNNVYLAIDTNIVYSWVVSTNSYKEIGDATILKTDDIVNTFDQTSIDKVASANTVKILYDTKVEKVTGKQLSTEDYTTAEKTKLAGIQEGAEVNVKANWTETNNTLDSFIENKPLIVDNLLSTSATDILSANQGNALDLKKIDKVPNYTDFLPKFNLDGSLSSSTKKTSDFEPANPNILKTTDIVDNLSGGDVGNTRQVLEASQGKVLKDQIDTKEPIINSGNVSQYWRGDKTWQSLNQNAVGISNRLITNVSQEVILSSLPTPDDTSDQNNVRVRVANTTVSSTRGADLELQAGNGTDGSGDVVFYGSATPENAITVGTNSGSSASSTTALSFSHTVTNVSDRLLIVQVVCSGGQQASSATFASTPLTLAERTQSTTLTIETWYLVNPSAQTGIVQVNFTNPVNNAVARAINLNGVDQTTPIGQKAEIFNNNQTTSASLSLSTTLGQIVVDFIGTYNVTATLSGGQTQIWSGSTPQQEKGQGSYEVAQTPTTAVSYTFANSSYAFHVIAINKVGGTSLGTITEFGRITASGIQSNGLILPSTAYTTAGTYILTQQSTTKHKVYNSGTYNINLPKATYLRAGMIYEFSNRGTGSLSIRTQDSAQIATCPPNYTILLELTDNSVGYNGVWEQSYVASSGSVEAYVTSQKGVANGVAPLNSTGVIPAQYVPSVAFPIGAIMALQVSPASFGSWLLLDGSAVSRSTYSALFSSQLTNRGTVTISQANPAVVTLSSHGLTAGQKVVFTSTGTLPTGITANTSVYYVMSTNLTTNTFQISATYGGTAIATTTAGSGTHTLYTTLYGYTLGNGSTNFGLPNYAGRSIIGSGNGGGLTTRVAGEFYGAETHTLTTDEMPAHNHRVRVNTANDGIGGWASADGGLLVASDRVSQYANAFRGLQTGTNQFMEPYGSGLAHNNMQPSVALPVFVYSGV